ncbi:MAG: hypothetical protein ACYDCQ_06075 [Dehalococcoidia bacterium]
MTAEQTPVTSADETRQILVLKDGAGNYYAIAEETLQQFRLSEEQKGEVARAIEETEVAGFYAPPVPSIHLPWSVVNIPGPHGRIPAQAIAIPGASHTMPQNNL